jgi:replicative DNA helicase
MGKTALALAFLRACARSGKACAVFSLEMSENQLTDRILSQETRIASAQDLQRGKITTEQLKGLSAKAGEIAKFPIFIDDTAGISISQLRTKAFKLKAQNQIELILVDYLQLMSAEGKGNREQEISQISRGLKKIAKELDLPVIALSQLSRAVETRGGDKRPQLSDLRESGAIEQDADIVIFLHRPEYYGITEDSNGQSTAGTAEIIFSKHRNGALDTIVTKFIGRFTEFSDLEEEPAPSPGLNDFNYSSRYSTRQTEF